MEPAHLRREVNSARVTSHRAPRPDRCAPAAPVPAKPFSEDGSTATEARVEPTLRANADLHSVADPWVTKDLTSHPTLPHARPREAGANVDAWRHRTETEAHPSIGTTRAYHRP